MKTHELIAELRAELDLHRCTGGSVGLVPTMGYLHDGHLSLMRRAASENDLTVATIFVNPLQFAPGEDLDRYPRDLEGDRAKAEDSGVDVLFVPQLEEMYPVEPVSKVVVGVVSERLEGLSRPSFFGGVATVVAKLFSIVGPCRAYFGEKDYQQLLVVRRMTEDLSLPVEVIGCPTVRESDGLAMSSRNAYLDPTGRDAAAALHRALRAGRDLIETGERSPDAVRDVMTAVLALADDVAVDYAEVADAATLETPAVLTGSLRLLVAARVGPARLIDNLGVIAP